MSSRETTLARHDAEQAAHNWLGHRKHCATCDTAANARRWGRLCPDGILLREAKTDADAAFRRERQLDRLPAPDQEAMF